ncbi:acyltransferase family protein [Nonomuraea typhae]|uniref:acyltransferase family protein n=1 Tax=Nonomuraea typhae TaxID=2603600 RepID=UPI001FE9CB75|nr:acyltransferase [Nonomuraea typhae]
MGRIEGATPATRDRAVDGLRAVAILGVVLGHWLVTALVAESGTIRVTSPLKFLPEMTPLSWAFQTLALFFLVGGITAATSYTGSYRLWLRRRLVRLARPVFPVVLVWAGTAGVMLASGSAVDTVAALVKLVVSPLWFLLVFAALTAATPLVLRLHPGWPLGVVVVVDVLRYGLAAPEWLGWVNLAAGWLVPYTLGAAWAAGRWRGRSARWGLLAGGAAAAAALVVWAGYPAAMVGVPGAPVSNLNPPTLAAVAFGLAQCGAGLLLYRPLGRVLRRPVAWAATALLNLSAMTIFLWHQTAMIAVTALALPMGPLPGVHTAPGEVAWLGWRLVWLPVFGAALLVCLAAFRSSERPRP